MINTKSNKTSLIQLRIDLNSKEELDKLLDNLGMTLNQAITIYLKQLLLRREIPFSISESNNKLKEKQIAYIEKLKRYNLLDEDDIPEWNTSK